MKRLVPPVAAATLLVAIGGARSAPAPGFTPKFVAGNWLGSWKNETFGSTGPAHILAKSLAKNTKLIFTANFGGNVFGCPDPPAESTKAMTQGKGPGHWNAAGFTIGGPSKAFGTVRLVYAHKTRTLTGVGSNPNCSVGLSWTITGKFTGNRFAGTVNIKLPDGTPAVSKVSLKRG